MKQETDELVDKLIESLKGMDMESNYSIKVEDLLRILYMYRYIDNKLIGVSHWEKENMIYKCAFCGVYVDNKRKFCPCCDSRMDNYDGG